MTDVKAQKSKLKAFALVRNHDGEPQFNDWDNVPEAFYSALSESDWIYINLQREKSHGHYT